MSACAILVVGYGYVPQGHRRHRILVDYDVLCGRQPSELETMLPSIACKSLSPAGPFCLPQQQLYFYSGIGMRDRSVVVAACMLVF